MRNFRKRLKTLIGGKKKKIETRKVSYGVLSEIIISLKGEGKKNESMVVDGNVLALSSVESATHNNALANTKPNPNGISFKCTSISSCLLLILRIQSPSLTLFLTCLGFFLRFNVGISSFI